MQTPVTALTFSLRHSWLVRAAGALLAIGAIGTIAAIPTPAHAGVYVSVNIAPPILPIYEQPMIPGDGYLWTPGYWAWSGDGYYWVPGAWVLPPFVGGLWTPGYWGWGDGVYIFHRGYWGRHVGFYGGINYGYGYGGNGYEGGYWRGGGFYYNRSVNRVSGNIRNVYNRTVVNNTRIINNRTSFNGGPRGIAARATPQQAAWGREQHTAPVAAQLRQRDMASHTQSLRASVNHGAPQARIADQGNAMRAAGAVPRGNQEMRSASFAPHGNQSMRSAAAGGYTPSTQNRGYAQPEQNRANERPAMVDRGNAYRPQNAAVTRNAPQDYRPTQNYARGPSRPANGRPVAHAAAPRGRATPAKRDDHQR